MCRNEAVERERYVDMADTQPPWVVTGGLDVIGSDGEKLGEVQEVADSSFIVKPGWLVPDAPSVSLAAITQVDANAVYLDVTKADVLNHGWEGVPTTDRHAGKTGKELSDHPADADQVPGEVVDVVDADADDESFPLP